MIKNKVKDFIQYELVNVSLFLENGLYRWLSIVNV